MAQSQAVEVLLRPAVELYTVAVCAGAALLCLVAPWSLALSPLLGLGSALAFLTFGTLRFHDAWAILRYRRNIRRLPRYVMTSRDVPVSQQRLFVGRGFRWDQRHTHRLMQTYRPEFRRYVEPTTIYRMARRMEERLEFAPYPLSKMAKALAWDNPLNPARPLPPVGGMPRLHGIEPHEVDVTLPLAERVGHSLVLGTTRVGKTRLAELFITQDIRRKVNGQHEVVIVFDPKGDADLLKRMYVEAKRAGREGEFYVFHLGWPDISARYNAVGRFGRISEVATRIAGQLSGEGNSAAFREFACVFDPALDKRQWYTQLMFAQHAANLAPVWGRSQGTGHPGITFFNRGGGPITFDPLNRLDRQMNAHLFLFGPTGSGKSATLNNILNQVTAIYRPRLFIVEAGNSFGLFGDFATRLGLKVHRVKLAPGAGVSLAPFADAHRLVDTPSQVQTLDADALDEDQEPVAQAVSRSEEVDEQRDVLGELEITARLMITGGEDKEEARMTRADRSLIRQCILDAAQLCVADRRTVLTRDVRDALRERARDTSLPEVRRARLLEMADAMDMFCQGVDGEMFDRSGTPWPEADITIVDLATFAREGYNAQLSISYISLINTVNNIAERDQFLGRPIINVTDEGHIITKNPLLAPYVVKITKMWRKLGAWYWLATQNIDDLPKAAEPMLNMIEWWICLSMPPDEVEKIARFRELNPAQKALMLSARKEAGKFTEGVILSKSMEVLFRAVPPSLYLALAQTEPEEKAERFQLMQQYGIGELDAAFKVAEKIDRARGIESLALDALA